MHIVPHMIRLPKPLLFEILAELKYSEIGSSPYFTPRNHLGSRRGGLRCKIVKRALTERRKKSLQESVEARYLKSRYTKVSQNRGSYTKFDWY